MESGKISGSEQQQVILNVGGRVFETSIKTLVRSSTYFASQFSDNWTQTRDKERPLFIDQDPDAFAVLLSYMRCGFVNEEQLSAVVLFQLEYFGMETLMKHVKLKAYQAHDFAFAGTDEEAIFSFDAEFGSIANALATVGLPALLRQPKQTTNEYITLYFHLVHSLQDGVVIPSLAGLCSKLFHPHGPSFPSDESSDAGGFMNPIFALNFLGKFGFRLAPPNLQNYTSASPSFQTSGVVQRQSLQRRGLHLGEWFFVREKQTMQEGGSRNISPSVIQTSKDPREYASIVWTAWGTFITAAGGRSILFERLGGALLRNVGIKRIWSAADAMQWLESHGFRTREEKLEVIFGLLTAKKVQHGLQGHNYRKNHIGRIMVFSRPLREHESLVDYIFPLPFGSDDFTYQDVVFPSFDSFID